MHRRAFRHGLVVLLFVAAAGAAAFAWSVDQQLAAIAAAEHRADSRFDTLVQSIARFDATQQLFDPAREPETDWFARVRRLLAQIESEATGLHTAAASSSAARTFDDITARVVSAVARAEENLRDGHDLMAADLVQDEAKPGAEAMRAAVIEWRAAEGNATETARTALVQQLWTVLGGTLGFWAIGVLMLAPRQTASAPAAAASLSILAEPAGETAMTPPAEVPPVQPAPAEALLDLVPAAELCADIARADSGETLAALVDRAADVIGASGIVVWLAGSDDELVPALARIRSACAGPAGRAAVVRRKRDHARVALGSAAMRGRRRPIARGARGPDVPGAAPHGRAGRGVDGRQCAGSAAAGAHQHSGGAVCDRVVPAVRARRYPAARSDRIVAVLKSNARCERRDVRVRASSPSASAPSGRASR